MKNNENNKKFDVTKPVQTRCGCEARIIRVECDDDGSCNDIYYPVIAFVKDVSGYESLQRFTKDGIYYIEGIPNNPRDLVNKPEEMVSIQKCESWLAEFVQLKTKSEMKRQKFSTSPHGSDYWEGRRDGLNDAIRIIQSFLETVDK